ncbi:hypothetical protein J4N45_09855 [Vibrio sp. SCSIO 43140]|uniref:hypothetical protein n=1 Tax=Vibrio sp. SCSIO 43140 TaxID=2819100 RepID=UPI0020751C36|nr:hypothetical protein [Vibrio sp. SCSIO 43140]USD58832.1 hypothetical protein J4N45_09855 [Vibrio sp. SCSIO 43140]
MALADLYEGIARELGYKPLVVYPQSYNHNSISIEVGGESSESYWLVVEDNHSAERRIIWLVGGIKPIGEAEGPGAYDCPMFLLELVPQVKNQNWRDEVERYWKLQDVDEPSTIR